MGERRALKARLSSHSIPSSLEDFTRSKMNNTQDVDNTFVFLCAILVFFMHTGFAMLEAGGVQEKNRQAILIKNVMLIATSAVSWWALGYLLAVGKDSDSVFAGRSDGDLTVAFLKGEAKEGTALINWFFGFAFAATS